MGNSIKNSPLHGAGQVTAPTGQPDSRPSVGDRSHSPVPSRMPSAHPLTGLASALPAIASSSGSSTAGASNQGTLIPPKAGAGEIIGQGKSGQVREDPENDGYVIKTFSRAEDSEIAKAEAKSFNRFYGGGSAELFESDKKHMRMLKVPGVPLNTLWGIGRPNKLPSNSQELYLKMIADMGDRKIIHNDLGFENIMYDESHRNYDASFRHAHAPYS